MKQLMTKFRWVYKKVNNYIHFIVLITILGAVLSLIGIYRALLMKGLVDSAVNINTTNVYTNLALLAVLLLVDVLINAFLTFTKTKTAMKITNNIQSKLYHRIIRTEWMDYLNYHSGDYLTRLTSDVSAITNVVVGIIPSLIALSILIIGSFVMIFLIDRLLAISIIIVLPLAVVFARLFSVKMKKIYLKNQAVESGYRSFINESIQNLLVIKSFCLEGHNTAKVSGYQEKRLRLTMSRTKLLMVSNAIMSFGGWIGFFIVFIWGSFRLSNGTTTFGTLLALMQLIGNIQGPFTELAASLPKVVYALASIERLMEIEDLTLDALEDSHEGFDSVGILFDGVSFSYKKEETILSNVSLDIKPGEIIGLIGPSGEGKTTFVHLVLALFRPDRGHVYLYNAAKKWEVSAGYRDLISYVPQGNNVFSGTIAENLRFGNPDASDEELEMVAKQVHAWAFISELEDGLYTKVGEQGRGLSEGQAQRIAIARALLRDRPILLLDEVTSALDSETEIKVLEGIKKLKNKPTCIIITHRPRALNICHRVIRVEDKVLNESLEYLNQTAM